MNRPADRGIFSRLATPHPPAELRAKTLAAARSAAENPQRLSWWQAITALFSAQPRWATALAVVLVAHLVLGLVRDGARSVEENLPRNSEVDAQPDLLRLPRIEGVRLDRIAAPRDIEDARLGRLAAPPEEKPGNGDPS